MKDEENEEKLLRAVALQNAQAVFLARERAERELRESNERITSILESISDAFIVLDKEWRFTYVNPRAEEILRPLNKSRANLLGKSHWLEFPDLVGTPLEEHYRRAMTEKVKVDLEIFYSPLNSWFQVRAYPSRDSLAIYFLDVSERKKAEQALRESEERSRAIVETTPECVKIVAADGTLQRMNSSGLAMVGADCAAMVVGKNIYDLIAPEDRERFRRFNEGICRGERGALEFDIIGLHGLRRHMETHAVPLCDSNGTVVQLAVTRDVTERRSIEDRLSKTQKMAAAGQLAASLAHEINNPLSSVVNLLYLLQHHSALDPEARKLVTTAENEIGRVARIVKQSLAYYRKGTKPKDIDLGATVEESVQVYRDKFDRAGIRLSKKVITGDYVLGFPDEIRQVIDNLLLNAVESMPGGGRLAVAVRPSISLKGGDRKSVRLTVADTGYGISKDVLSRIFDPFFTTKLEKGTGLGLWIVHGLVIKHEGTIRVRSSVRSGKCGTVVSILWPRSSHEYAGPSMSRAESVG